jgi:uncharacterized protein (UPF0276 family)
MAPQSHTDLNQRSDLGFGLGLRREMVLPIIEQQPQLDWLEILSDWYLESDSRQLDELLRIRERYPLVMHGGALSLGGPDPLDETYLAQLQTLAERIRPAWISDHLCWTLPGMSHSYDLRPLPRTQEMIDHLIPRILTVQERLGQRILLENISDPGLSRDNQMPEWEFLARVAEASDSLILLDLNNILSNSLSQGFSASKYVKNLPAERIWQIHLAPLVNRSEYDWDADARLENDPVWLLYGEVLGTCDPVSTMIERNDDIPPLEELMEELEQARSFARSILNAAD